MDNYMIPFIVRDVLLCLVFLLGIAGGILALRRDQRRIGQYVLAGFLLLSLDPLSEFIIFNVLSPAFDTDINYQVFNWSYVCISSPATILGSLALMAGIYYAIQPLLPTQGEKMPASNDPIYTGSDKNE